MSAFYFILKHCTLTLHTERTKKMMFNILCVGLGGFVGSTGRYLMSMLPFDSALPFATLLTNFIGAVAIGFISGLAGSLPISKEGTLFLKTGICGGFTTFSTFSLETFDMLKAGKLVYASAYAVLSVFICIAGVGMGLFVAGRIVNNA